MTSETTEMWDIRKSLKYCSLKKGSGILKIWKLQNLGIFTHILLIDIIFKTSLLYLLR